MEVNLTTLFDKTKRYFTPTASASRTSHEQELLETITLFFEAAKREINPDTTSSELIKKIMSHPNWPWVDQQMLQIVRLHELPEEFRSIINKKEIQLALWKNNRPHLLKLLAPHRMPTGVFYFLAVCLLDFLELHGHATSSSEKLHQHSIDMIDSLQDPFVMLEESGELVASNLAFSQIKLLPKECLALKDDAKIERQGEVYIVKKSICDIKEGRYHILIFLSVKNFLGDNSIDVEPISDLGIITSSIAHELNNPIAGILASVQVLKLDPQLREEFQLQLEEMEKSAKKCKELVKIFLGFSKDGQLIDENLSFYQCLEHATSLLRSRMMENNVVLNTQHISDTNAVHYPERSAGMVMALYLILNELMTALSKNSLLEWNSSNRSRNLSIVLQEREHAIHLRVSPMPSGIELSQPLLLHLLTIENYHLDCDADGMTFRKRN